MMSMPSVYPMQYDTKLHNNAIRICTFHLFRSSASDSAFTTELWLSSHRATQLLAQLCSLEVSAPWVIGDVMHFSQQVFVRFATTEVEQWLAIVFKR